MRDRAEIFIVRLDEPNFYLFEMMSWLNCYRLLITSKLTSFDDVLYGYPSVNVVSLFLLLSVGQMGLEFRSI